MTKVALKSNWCLAILIVVLVGHHARISSAQAPVDFNREIRPLLSENCFFCHGQDPNQRQAGLRMDLREEAVDYGALTPGDAGSSSLVERIFSDDPELQMPPPDSNRSLTQSQKEKLKRWIEEGAEYQKHWAFVAPVRPNVPDVVDERSSKNPIDAFVLAKLKTTGLSPSPRADRATLIKRLSIDLTGLPPTLEEVNQFVADPSPDAYTQLVDRLLASPHYGERMALPWLDAARYSDSNGFQQDGDTWQWIWRDWVVKALNEDMPFDQFTIWQLAGDLLPDATTEQQIASGFNRNHMLNGEGGAIKEEQRFVNLFDRIDTTATNWMGLTMACAQCHDHKYDPITQRDYYSLLDAFNRVLESGVPSRQSDRIRVASPFLELPTKENEAEIAKLEEKIEAAYEPANKATEVAFVEWRDKLQGDYSGLENPSKDLAKIAAIPAAERSESQQKKLKQLVRNHFDYNVRTKIMDKIPALNQLQKLEKQLREYRGDQIPRVMIMRDEMPRQSHILLRGEYLNKGDEVTFATPAFLPPMPEDAPKDRLGLAHWLMAPENPLTARVQVNRMWQHFFGSGIVLSTEDLGVQSEYPQHRELLDWLAVEFRESGWRMKHMHRLIVTSETYQQSSRVREDHRQLDPANRLYARASRFRMPAMLLRDWALATSGLLVDTIGGAPVYPYQPDNVWEPLAITKERDFTYPASAGKDLYRRSLYTFWRRTVGPANMFDASNRQACRVRKSITSTPLHALTTLNDRTWVEAARVLAQHCMTQHPTSAEQTELAFAKTVCRQPTDVERQQLRRAFEKQLALFEKDQTSALQLLSFGSSPRDETLDAAHHAALTTVCLAILNLDEALTRE